MAASVELSNGWTRTLLILGIGVLAAGLIVLSSPLLALLVVSAVGVMVLAFLCSSLTSWSDDAALATRILRWTMASFGLHLLIGMVIINSSALYFFGPDALTYDGLAKRIVSHWVRGTPLPFLPGGKEGFYYMLAAIYWLLGPSKWGGVALNAILAAALIPIVSDTAYRLFGRATVRYVPYLLVLVPGMLLWPSQLLKEAPYFFLLAAAANCATRLVDHYSPLPLVMLALLLPGLLLFRAQVSFAVLAGMVAGVTLGRRRVVGGLIGGMVAASLVAFVVASGVGSGGYQTAVSTDLEKASHVRQGLSGAASGFGSDTDISTANQALTFLPKGMLSASVGPFPWQLHGGRQLIVLPDVAAWWVLVVGFWWGVRAARAHDRRWLVVVAPAAAAMAVLALSIGNYGTLVRERMQLLVLIAPVIAFGFAARRASRAQHAEDALVA
jgi:hypothetical protein